MELAHVLVLLIVGYTAASPYGYGTKGGAVAKANANAAASAYTGVGDVPISIPSNTGYSGSFSKSFSSSSSSSSASSSSSSFSYSGSGSGGYGASGCGSGSCHGSQGSTGAGAQSYGAAGANSLSSVGGSGGKIPTSSYAHKYNHGSQTQDNDCGSEGCQGSNNSIIKGTEITSDAKATAATDAGLSTGSNCGGSDCNNSSNEKCSSGDCSSSGNTNSDKKINNCVSGDCGTDSQKSEPPQDSGETCTSGQCGSKKDTESGSSIDHIDIHVPVSVTSDSKSNYQGSHSTYGHQPSNTISEPGCSSGDCGPSGSTETKPYQNPSTGSGSLPAHSYAKPATHLTTPKLESPCTTPNCQKAPNNSPVENNYQKNNPCDGGTCGQTGTPYTSSHTVKVNQAPSSSYSGPSNVKPDNYYGSSPSNTPVNPSGSACSPGTPGCSTPVIDSSSSSFNYGGSTNIKPSYIQGSSTSYSPSQPSSASCAPGDLSCFPKPIANTQPDCTTGLCAEVPSSPISSGSLKPSYSQETYYPIEALGQNCAPGSSGCASTPIGASDCIPGNCGTQSSIPGYGGSPVSKPSKPGCSPGTPGCTSTYSYSGSVTNKPSNSYGIVSSNPLASTPCSPGSPGCAAPSGCASGNCGSFPSTAGVSNKKPSYTDGISASYTPVNPSIPGCLPGSPGCSSTPPSGGSLIIKPSPYGIASSDSLPCSPGSPGCGTAPSACLSGNCGSFPATPAVSNIKPSYADGVSTSYSPVKPSSTGCLPGNPGCGSPHVSFTIKPSNSYDIASSNLPLTPCSPGSPGCASASPIPSTPISLNYKPSYSHGYSLSYSPVIPSKCAPGTPGCSGPEDCASENCGSSSVNGGTLTIKPGYSAGISPSYPPLIPSGPACSPGSPGCAPSPSTHSYSSSYGSKPSYSQGASPSYVSVPSIASCVPGTPGCGTTLPIPVKHPDNSNVNVPIYSNLKPSGSDCTPGTSGCTIPTNINSPPGCSYGKCGSAGYGGSISFKPSYSQNNPLPCTPGASGCTTPTNPGLSSCAPGSPGCISNSLTSASPAPGYSSSSVGTSHTQGSFGLHSTGSIQTSFNKPITDGFHIDSSGSYTPGSASGIPTTPLLGSGTLPAYVPGIGSSPSKPSSASSGINSIVVASGASVQGEVKDKVPYTGGFGGPAGILNPNESNFTPYKPGSISTPSTATTTSTTLPASCSSGDCQHGHTSPSLSHSGSNAGTTIPVAISPSLNHAGSYGGTTISAAPSPSLSHDGSNSGTAIHTATSPSLSHSGSNSGTVISAGASASADAVAYTGGFGGPPGLLSPYDNGKIGLKSPSGKQLLDSSLDSNKGPGGNVLSTYSNGGAQVSGNAVAQANAATFGSTGGHGTGGCGGGCGGSSDYNDSLGHSKTGGLDDASIAGADASAGAVAKCVANASSNTKGYGGSYASSSATAHASAGASVKTGYGRR